jgi:hypothetical protein
MLFGIHTLNKHILTATYGLIWVAVIFNGKGSSECLR